MTWFWIVPAAVVAVAAYALGARRGGRPADPGERLRDVVDQVGAARQAATATHERVAHTSQAAATMVRRARSADEAATALNESLHQVAGIASLNRAFETS